MWTIRGMFGYKEAYTGNLTKDCDLICDHIGLV